MHYPAHPDATETAERLERMGKTPAFSADEHLARAAAYQASGDPKAALAELELAEPPKDARAPRTRAQLHLSKASALFALGQEEDAFLQLDDAMGGPSAVAADAMMLRARRLMKGGENRVARDVLLSLDEKYPKEAPAEDAGYLGAWLAMQAGDFDQAVTDFDRFEARHPGSRKRDEARWFKAFSQIRAGKLSPARATLSSLLDEFPRSQLVPQARYWLARAAQLSLSAPDGGAPLALADAGAKGPSTASLAADYRALIAASPGSFYAPVVAGAAARAG